MDLPYLNDTYKFGYKSNKKMKIPINLSVYKLQKVICETPYCVIISSNDPNTNQKIAIKCVPIYFFQDGNKELIIMDQIKHPNIIPFLHFFEYPNTNPRFFVIITPLANTDLFYYIDNEGPLSESMTWKVMKDSLEAVNYLHKNKIWHLDLKLENILVLEEGKNGLSIAISDFGLSDIVETETYHGPCVGTLAYAAPELVEFNLGSLEFKKIGD